MRLHLAIWPLLGLCVSSLSVPAAIPQSDPEAIEVHLNQPNSPDAIPLFISPEDGSPSTDLAKRDIKTDDAVYEDVLNKRNLVNHRRWIQLTLKRAIGGVKAQTFKFVIDLAYKDEHTMWQTFVRRLSTTGTWVTRELADIDHEWLKPSGYDLDLQYAFNVIIDAHRSFRLRLRWEDWITVDLASAHTPKASWCALVDGAPGNHDQPLSPVDDFGFTFTDIKPKVW